MIFKENLFIWKECKIFINLNLNLYYLVYINKRTIPEIKSGSLNIYINLR